MKFKEFGVKIKTKCTNLMMEDICMKIEKYTLSFVLWARTELFIKSGQKLIFFYQMGLIYYKEVSPFIMRNRDPCHQHYVEAFRRSQIANPVLVPWKLSWRGAHLLGL